MDPISVTFSQAGRPFLTTRVRSVAFQESTGLQGTGQSRSKDALRTAGTGQRDQATPSTGSRIEGSGGFGSEAQRNSILANAIAAAEGTDASGAESPDGLTEAEREQVEKLKARDAEVRRHEQAHAAVGGQYASAPSYTYQQGPDGRRYAIGGEVKIDVAPVAGDPEATIEKMGVVKAAALAPAEPSAADRRVAALADAQRLQAVAELASLRSDERLETFGDISVGSGTARGETQSDGAAKSDLRFAQAAAILSRSEAADPGQKVDRTA